MQSTLSEIDCSIRLIIVMVTVLLECMTDHQIKKGRIPSHTEILPIICMMLSETYAVHHVCIYT